MRLPRNGREFPLFLLIVSLISVNIIAPLITMYETNFSVDTWGKVLPSLPIVWVLVVICVILTSKPAAIMSKKLIEPTDSFYAQTIVQLLCNVFLMSVIMTALGFWAGHNFSQWISFNQYIHAWPRNFGIAFAIEALIAHPVAHFLMYHYHVKKDLRRA